jgi:hypothetical protein
MIWRAAPEAHEIDSVATNNAETARCYNAGQEVYSEGGKTVAYKVL